MYANSTRIADALKRRGVQRMVYFHCDHFEPWRDARGSISRRNADDVREFAEVTAGIEYARRLTLFYKCHVPSTMSAAPRSLFAQGDGFGFLYPSDEHFAITSPAIRHLAHDTGHEIQVHVHHEYYIGNEKYCFVPQWSRRFFEEHNTPALDQIRFRLGLELTLKVIRREADIALDRWMFVHGTWALNASDRDVCSITNEIELLQEYGCLGDFTFPAGRSHCDPDYTEPVFVRPVTAPKGYNLPEAGAESAWGNVAAAHANRFFIWASVIKAGGSSIDHYWDWVRKRSEDVENWALDIVEHSVVQDGTLFFKTHSHSMYMDYFQGDAKPIHPHAYPGVRNLFGVILQGCSEAGVAVDYLTTQEVYNRYVGVTPAEMPSFSPPAPVPTQRVPDLRVEPIAPAAVATEPVALPPTLADEAGETVDEDRPSEAELEAMYQTAAAEYRANRFAESVEAWQKLRPYLSPSTYRLDHYFYYQMKNLGLGLNRRAEALALSDDAIALGRDHGGTWFVRGVLLRMEGRNNDAMTALRRAFRQNAERGYAALNMAAILTEAGRYRMAWKLIEVARADKTSESGFRQVIATAALGVNKPEESLAAAAALEAVGDPPPVDLVQFANAMRLNEFRHIAVTGASALATTTLGVLLGSLDGACHVGDTAELNRPVSLSVATGTFGAVYAADVASGACRVCGPRCGFATTQFRQALQDSPEDWYRKVARRLGTKLLVTSERLAAEYRLKDPQADYDQIVLFGRPEAWLTEMAAQIARGEPLSEWDVLPEASLAEWLDHWVANYRSLLHDTRPRRRVVLDWDGLAANAEMAFASLLAGLDLPPAPLPVNLRIEHLLGGSHDAQVTKMLGTKVLALSDVRLAVSAEAREAVAAHAGAQEMYRRLSRLQRPAGALQAASA